MKSKLKLIQNLSASKISIIICFILFVLPTFILYLNYNISKSTNNFEFSPLTNFDMALVLNILIYVLPLISTISGAQYAKKQEAMSAFIFTRESKDREIVKSFICFFIWGFFLMFITLITMYLISIVSINFNTDYFPAMPRNLNFEGLIYEQFPFNDLYYNYPVLFQLFYIVLISFYSAFLSSLSFIISSISKKGFTISLYIFGASLLVILLCGFFRNGIVVWNPQNLLMPDPLIATYPGIFTNPIGKIVLFSFLAISSLCLLIYRIKSKKI
ncbi:MAG: hypothetical protein RR557_07500 [Bacilli bacterium]